MPSHERAVRPQRCALRGLRNEIAFAVVEGDENALARRPRSRNFPWYAEGRKGGGMVAIEGKESPSQVRCLVTPWCFSEDALDTDTESIARPASTRDLGETLAALFNAELWTRTLASNARRRRAIAFRNAFAAT